MKRIRVGKDISIQWVLHAPAGVVLTSENLTIELKDPKGRQADVENFTLEAQQDKFTVNFALRGTAFSQLGNYTLTAWLNKGEQGQSVVDAVNAFTLVGSTQAEDDVTACGCGCLNTATIDMQGDLSFAGQPGYSPTANVVKEGDTVTITITDKEGTTTATVKDGKDGDDGISPTAEVSKSGSVVTISITDKEGTHTATVRDGIDGNDGTSPTVTISKSGDTITLAITDKTGIHIAEIKDGVKGDDGVSPTANVVKSGNTATITITDKNGISSASISDGADGNDGISPTVSTSKSNGVTTVTITDKNGSHVATIDDGEDGYSPSASVTQTSSGAIISVTDKNGTTTAEVSNGTQGNPGVSPAVSIETIQGGHQVTITDATHPQGQIFDVMDGQDVTEIFWATYGTTTAAQIQAAIDAGKVVMCSYNNNVYEYARTSSTAYIFGASIDTICYALYVTISNSTWSSTSRSIPYLPNSICSGLPTKSYDNNLIPSTTAFRDVIAGVSGGLEELTNWTTSGTYYDMSGSTVPTTVTTTTVSWQGLLTECNAGDVFLITGQGGTKPRAVGFADENKNILFVTGTYDVADTLYVAPPNTKYIVLARNTETQKSYRVISAREKAEAVDAKIEGPWTKLVDTILEEDTTNTGFSVNLAKDCSKLKVIAVFPANASLSSNTNCYFGITGRSGSTILICGSAPLRSTPAKVIAEYTYESGLGWQGVFSQFANATFNEDGNNSYTPYCTNLRGANVGAVYSVRIFGNNVPLIAGTKIKIWGK